MSNSDDGLTTTVAKVANGEDKAQTESVPHSERIGIVIGLLKQEHRDLCRTQARRNTDGIRAAEEKRALESSIDRRAVNHSEVLALRAQYADDFAALDERIDAPEQAEQRLLEIEQEIPRLERQLPQRSVAETLRAWGTQK